MRIGDAGVIESIIDCPMDSTLSIVAQILVHFYAVLLTNDLGEVKGIITRADMLKPLCSHALIPRVNGSM
jgi:predicted transcriptional regulator